MLIDNLHFIFIFYFQIIAISNPIQFVHKNDCNCNMAFSPKNNMVHIKRGQVSKKLII